MGSASQATARPCNAACAAGKVSISWRLYQGWPLRSPAGGAYSGVRCVAVGTRLAAMMGS